MTKHYVYIYIYIYIHIYIYIYICIENERQRTRDRERERERERKIDRMACRSDAPTAGGGLPPAASPTTGGDGPNKS